jgi:hypothetical protein
MTACAVLSSESRPLSSIAPLQATPVVSSQPAAPAHQRAFHPAEADLKGEDREEGIGFFSRGGESWLGFPVLRVWRI